MRAHRSSLSRGFAIAVLTALAAITPLVAGVDADGDGYGELTDCDDHNDQVWTVPGETTGLRFSNRTTLEWIAPQNLGGTPASVRSDTLRSTSASNFGSAPPSSCFDPEGLTASSTDPSNPASGTVFFYLVRAKNDCGGAGRLGNRSDGTPRVGVECDCAVLCSDANTCTRDRCSDGVCVHDPILPTIQAPPESQATCPGDDPRFSVRASGQGTLHYQWRKAGALVGADNALLALSGVTAGDNGSEITSTVTDNCASATSAAAVLTVFSSTASCSGGGNGLEAPNGASEVTAARQQYFFAQAVNYDLNSEHLGSGNPVSGGSDARIKMHNLQDKKNRRMSVYAFSGEFYLEETDLAIEGRGVDFVWTRKYRSKLDTLTGLGHNWDFSYNRFVYQDLPGTDLFVADGNSRSDRYQPSTTGCWAAQGFFRELCPQVDGSYVLTFPDKTTWKFRALDGSPAQGRIEQIQDSNNNALTFSYDAAGRLNVVTDTQGRPVTVAYNSAGYISKITDFAGREVRYDYYGPLDAGGMPGDLKAVTSPAVIGTLNANDFPDGKTTGFQYAVYEGQEELNHNLLEITGPAGQVILRNTYTTAQSPTDPRFDRIDHQTFPNGTVSYVYVAQSPSPGSDAVTKTIVNDRGNVQEVFFNALNQAVMEREYTGRAPIPAVPTDDSFNQPTGQLRATDPPYFETRSTWSSESLLTSVVFPEGNSVQHTYDSANPDARLRANLLQRVSSPGPRGGDQLEIAESWTYGTSFGSEPCACPGCCGEGSGSHAGRVVFLFRTDRGVARTKALPRTEVAKKMWSSYTSGTGHTYTQDIDPTTGSLLHTTAPIVTTGVLGGGTQTIAESFEYNAFGQVTAHINPTGRRDEVTYYAAGPQTGYLKDVTIDADSPIPGSHLALKTTYQYDLYGNVSHITDPRGATEKFHNNSLNQLVRYEAKPPFNYQTDSCYNANDELVRIDVQNVDETGAIRPNAYASSAYLYDANAVLLRETFDADTLDIRTVYEHDAVAHTMLRKLPESVNGHQPDNVVRTRFDERGLVFRVTTADGSSGEATTQFDYDGNRNVVAIREGLEATPHVTTFVLDGYDRRTRSTDPLGTVTSGHYDADGNQTSTRTDGELIDGESGANVRLYEAATTFDEVGRTVQRDVAFFDPETGTPVGDGSSTTKTFYNEASQVVSTKNDNDHSTNVSYDNANRVASTEDPEGNTVAYGYDANGNVLTVTETEISDLPTPPETFVTTNAFDALDRMTSTTDFEGNVHIFLWDCGDNQTVHIDAKGNETRTIFDALGRATRTERKMLDTGEAGGSVSYVLDRTRSYDDDSRLTLESDDNENASAYQYDPSGRLVATIFADGTSELHSYDVHSNLISTTDANGTVTNATFDALNRLATRSIAPAVGVLGTTSETWKYRAKIITDRDTGRSRILYAQNDAAVVTRAYDSLSNLTRETLTIGAGPTRALTAEFDGAGNRTSIAYAALRTTGSFDGLQRKKTLVTSGPGTCSGGATPGAICASDSDCLPTGTCAPMAPLATSFDYAGKARYAQIGRSDLFGGGTGVLTTFAYDTERRITRTTHVSLSPSSVIDDRAYAWDAMDNKTSRTELNPPGSGAAQAYSYDSAYRMTRSVRTPLGLPPNTIDYALDGVGNRTSVTGGPEAGPYSMSSIAPEPADRPVNQYSSTPFDVTRSHDRNGNLVQKSGSGETLSYDYHNQMVRSQGPLGTVTYAYDPFWRRIVADGRHYFYDGDQEIEERNAAGTLTAAYVYGNGIDEVVIAVGDVDADGFPDRSYPLTDDLGNVVAVTSEAGEVLERYAYRDLGQPLFLSPSGSSIQQSAIGNPILFNSHRYDQKTGLYYYRTRYLDPHAGRFTSRDSIGAWGDPSSLGNAFTFAASNPLSHTDPFGSAIEPREILKTFFAMGDKPTSGQFNILIDSALNLADDRGGNVNWNFGGSGSVAKTGTVKFFNQTKGFGFERAPGGTLPSLAIDPYTGVERLAKLCPGHVSCPPLGSSGLVSLDATAGVSTLPDPPSPSGLYWSDGTWACYCHSNCTVSSSWSCWKLTKTLPSPGHTT